MQRMLAKVCVCVSVQSQRYTIRTIHVLNKIKHHKAPSKQKNPNRVYTLGYFQSEMNNKQGQLHNFSTL